MRRGRFSGRGVRAFVGFSTHAPCKMIVRAIQTGEFDYVNLHWYFVYDLNWPAIEEAGAAGYGGFHHQPQ